jgi:phospholipid-binding lipoprotein MlaA
LRPIAVAVTGSLLLALASPALAAGSAPNPDPWEKFNRKSFAINQTLDRYALRPLAMVYSHVLPAPVRDGLHNVLSNLDEPVVLVNDVLQGRFHRAGVTTGRIVANTVLGIGGVFDVATKLGAPHHDNGFDVTLGRYHVKPGPYLFIPLLGPSTVRAAVGSGVDAVSQPLYWIKYPHHNTVSIVRFVVGGLDTRARVDDQYQALMSDATDPYATLRSVYLQNQQSQVDAGEPLANQPLPDFGDPTPSPTTPPPAAPPAAAPPAAPTDPIPPTPPTDSPAPASPTPPN